MPRRIVLLFVIILLLWAGLVARAMFLQILPNDKLSHRQQKQFQTAIMLEPRRGSLSDRNGKDLASSVAAYSVFVDPQIIQSPKWVSRVLAPILGVSERTLLAKIKQRKKRFVWLSRKVEVETKEKIEKYKIRGIGFIEESKRIYPNLEVLSQTLGFVGSNGMGLEGLELQFNELLSGNNKKVEIKKDARGTPLILNGQMFLERQDGYDLQLTIDLEMQYVLEQELKTALEEHEADSAVGIVLDANTSEILAMSSYPTFNANDFQRTNSWLRRNRVVTDPFEPGSTMKTFTIAAALKAKQFNASSKIYGEKGKMQIADKWIREADERHVFEWLSVTEVLAKSSNIGTTKIAFQVGDKRLFKSFKEFGFGDKITEDLPGESRGILSQPPWRRHLLSNISFGHGIAVTPLQIANAYAAIANGGTLHRPFIVRNIRDNQGEIIKENDSHEVRQVLSKEDAKAMRKMLLAATSKEGTGFKAGIAGFSVAGKTGTAQKVNPNGLGYIKGSYVSSFAGFVPYEKPKYVIYIAVDNPKKQFYGSDVAAPIFSRMASYAMLRSGMAPTVHQASSQELGPKITAARQLVALDKVQRLGSKEQMPDLLGLNLRESIALLRDKSVKIKVYGEGVVKKTLPDPGAEIKSNQTVNLILTKEL
jgi:cell division protein FtsI (penicillin-binding protein 3)